MAEAEKQLADTGWYVTRVSLILMTFSEVVAAECYQIYDRQGVALYEGFHPPFDISYPGNSPAYSSSRAGAST